MFNFTGPIDLYPRGIRQFLTESMVGRSVAGYVQRVNRREDFGQCIILKLDGSLDVLGEIEARLLAVGDFQYELISRCPIESFGTHRQFTQIVSGAGATCGTNSDRNYDHPPSVGSRAGGSSCSGGSGKASTRGSASSSTKK